MFQFGSFDSATANQYLFCDLEVFMPEAWNKTSKITEKQIQLAWFYGLRYSILVYNELQ